MADFDFRMIPEESGARADGFGFMLLDTATFGISGEGPPICCYDEPNIPNSFAVGFDIFADLGSDPNDNHLSLHFNGITIESFPNPGFDLANGVFNHAHIELNFVPGGANITVILTPDSLSAMPGEQVTPILNYFIEGLLPYESRVAFGARTGGLRADHDLDNIVVVSAEVQEVAIDIKPGSDTNPINLKSKGVIPVAILTTDTFDATTIDPLSVRFGPKGAKEAHQKGHIEDVNHDGEPDLVLHFQTQATGIQCGDTSASLTGETVDGDPIQGSDTIKTVGCNKSNNR